jgi:hypothetical protein
MAICLTSLLHYYSETGPLTFAIDNSSFDLFNVALVAFCLHLSASLINGQHKQNMAFSHQSQATRRVDMDKDKLGCLSANSQAIQ